MNNGGRSGSSQWSTILWIHGLNHGLEGLLTSKKGLGTNSCLKWDGVGSCPEEEYYIPVIKFNILSPKYTLFLWIMDGFMSKIPKNETKQFLGMEIKHTYFQNSKKMQ